MTNRKTPAGESGYSNPVALIVSAIRIFAILAIGAAALLASVSAASDISTSTAYAQPAADFPAQFVNRGAEVELMMEMGD